jgi:hypothetical protein
MDSNVRFPIKEEKSDLVRKVVLPLALITAIGAGVLASSIYLSKKEAIRPQTRVEISTEVYTMGKNGYDNLWKIAEDINKKLFNGERDIREIVDELRGQNKISYRETGNLQPGRRISYSQEK